MGTKSAVFRVIEGEDLKLKNRATSVDPFFESKEQYKKLLRDHVKELSKQQSLLYASNTHAVLLIIQGMDTAGKDGVIKHVMSGINPQGCEVFSFKQPSAEELKHDFLWRTSCRMPERGRIGIFNRSYYEEVVIVRVHPELLLAQGLSKELLYRKTIWEDRYHSIVDHEAHLHRNGTRIIKVFLHISNGEQRNRLLERIDIPEKNWKFNDADLPERMLWDQYQKAYERCLSATSTTDSPWFVVPADDKRNARLIVSQIILDTLEQLQMNYPETDKARRQELKEARRQLHGE